MEDISKMTDGQLIRQILRLDEGYWDKGIQLVSDPLYDRLIQELEKRDPTHPLIWRLKGPKVNGPKVTYTKPMLSLQKAYSLEQVVCWASSFRRSDVEMFLVQPKYDGISVLWNPRPDGSYQLSTRGDGYVGEDISKVCIRVRLHALEYEGPLVQPLLDTPAADIVSPMLGELVIRKDDFLELQMKYPKKDGSVYKTPRNAVVGLVSSNDLPPPGILTLVDYHKIQYRVTLEELVQNWNQIVKDVESLPYPLDGIVIKLADETYAESLGATAHHPRGAIAFKFTAIRERVTLTGVEWSCGKSAITPVALFTPVLINGVKVGRASLHNIKNIEDRNICIGDTLIVERAGDVIPYVVDTIPGKVRQPIELHNCPSCGQKLFRIGPDLFCRNKHCSATKLRKLLAAASIFDIEGLGASTIQDLVKHERISRVIDIFRLTELDLLNYVDRYQQKSASKLYQEIQKCIKRVPDYQVLAALSISHIGLETAKVLCGKYTLYELLEASPEDLQEIQGIGMAKSFAIVHEMQERHDEIEELIDLLKPFHEQKEDDQLPTICFTGKMPEPRSYYEQLARDNGYIPVKQVTKHLNYLVISNRDHASTKVAKAREGNVFIVPLESWLRSLKHA